VTSTVPPVAETFTPPIYAQYPDTRQGNAYAVQFITLLDDPTSLHVYYRYYRDDWHIASDTVNLELYRDLSRSFVRGFRGGCGAEYLAVASLVRTLAANAPEVRRVLFVSGGEPLATLGGHVPLDRPVDVSDWP
jgi:hypothetical protein